MSPKIRYWWVNQGFNYEYEREGGYLWAPLHGKGGRVFSHHTNVSHLQPGDLVFNYSKTLRAVSQVLENSRQLPRPGSVTSQDLGYLAKVRYYDLPEPIYLDSIPQDWRIKEGGIFNHKGGVTQVYLLELSEEFVKKLAARFKAKLPNLFE
ncbi:MAG: hypothetical protein WCS37_16305, partial [Chloroflexota bacterium]|nr:hypothetical protein [Chloroflexota bacterium]